MRQFFSNIAVAFSMYSKIPVPQADWTRDNMKYSLCFFPLVGVVIGLLEFGWYHFAAAVSLGTVFRSAVMTVIPVIVTGGIHVDGLLDTSDALSSWREREKRLEILKDSHAGAFAVIIGIVFFITVFGAASEVSFRILPVVCLCFPMARALSALSVNYFPNANPKGTAEVFRKNAEKRTVGISSAAAAAACGALAVWAAPVPGLLMILAAMLMILIYHHVAMKYFGGITGDLAGFFLCICELASLIAAAAGDKIVRLIMI